MSFDTNPYANATTTDYIGSHAINTELADRGTRLVASIIDSLVMMLVITPVIFLIGFVFSTAERGNPLINPTGSASIGIQLVSSLLGFIAFALVNGTFLARSGQTIGKKLMKIKILNSDFTPANLNTLLLKRYGIMVIIGAIPFVGGLISLVNVLLIFRESRKCLHDDIASTIVVKA